MEIKIKKLIQDKIIKLKENNIILDINEINQFDIEFYDELKENPIQILKLIKKEFEVFDLKDPKIVILNWKDEIDISDIRVKDIGKTAKLSGMVSKITEPMALVVSKSFECRSCGTILKTNGKNPERCSCGRMGGFKEIDTELQNIQEMILEELQEKTGGKQPRKIRIRLTDNLTDKSLSHVLKPGNRVSLIGRVEKIELNNKTKEEIYQYRVFALDVSSLEESFDDTVSDEDMIKIIEISQNNPIKMLSNSLAPNIYGLEELKKILLLQMVGGVKKELSDGKFTRDWINILVVGEPSCAKSELAKNINLRCPKSFYASGDGSSGVGITVSVSKDELLGSWGVEIGPLVKASGGLIVLDEIDKFPKDQLKSLHTPLELGFVRISKAGVDSQFPAETSVLALANPKYGIFEEDKSLIEQINLPPALLSRFDIIYILKDKINKELDDKIVEVIYSKKKKANKDINLIDVPLFRKYINYSKKLNPILKEEYLEDLQNFYHEVRKKSISKSSKLRGMPIGVRHLQGIIRLSEASAKLNLREEVTKEDIELAKNLFYESLIKIGMDEEGIIDLVRIGSGKTVSKRKYMEKLIEIIRSVNSEELTETELSKIAQEQGFTIDKFYDTLNDLNREGIVIKSDGKWKII